MKSLKLAVLSPALFAGAIALAQTPTPGPAPGGPPNPGFDVLMFHGPEAGVHQSLRPVLNSPYQGQAETTRIQHLADGNVIEKNHTAKMARDKQGRTWMEETVDHIGPWASKETGPKTLIFIFDPVAGYSYTLHPDTKTAERRTMPKPRDAANNERHRARFAGKFGPGAEPRDNADMKVEDLGTQQVNGVAAQGKRTTHTIPANTMGNALPIVSVNERWFSPDLQMVVESKRSDPRFGDSTFDLKNIQKGDPPATLFQVPGDYTVKDAHRFAGAMRKRR